VTDAGWEAGFAKSLTVFVDGEAISEPGERGRRIHDDSFLLLFNASERDLEFAALPPPRYGPVWQNVIDTAMPGAAFAGAESSKPGDLVPVTSRSIQVLRRG
jgi:isoamylase